MAYNPLVMERVRQVPAVVWLITAVLLFFFLALDSLVEDSPTMDEQNHLARGLALWRTGDPRLSLEHPPLVNALSALPLLTLPDIRLPTDHPSWQRPNGWYQFADLLLWQYNQDVTRMIFLARLPIVYLTLVLALVGYRFAHRLWGRPSAPFAFLFTLFDPNVLAHGRYTTTDVGGTTFLLLAVFLLWRLWQQPQWRWQRWLAAAVGLGLAFGSKLSILVFVPILALLAMLPLYGRSRAGAAGRLLQFLAAGLLAIVVVWALFAFEWRPFSFQSPVLSSLNRFRGPMPTYWAGIEQIATFTSGGRGDAFLLGQFSNQGFWAYFPVAFLAKTPLPTLILLPLAAVFLLKEKITRPRALFLLIPALLYFLISMQSALNIGYRHLLPLLPFLHILSSGLAGTNVRSPASPLVRRAVLLLAFLAVLVADFFIHPHYLSYFNVAAGGPENGYRILVDSNIDWGQDLLRLRQWMAENGVETVNLAWFGSADPQYYGISHHPLPGVGRERFYRLWAGDPFNAADPPPGVYAISVTNLWELPRPVGQKYVYPWFRAHQPSDRVGYSILIYDVH